MVERQLPVLVGGGRGVEGDELLVIKDAIINREKELNTI